jgi:hypothetical protein
MKAQIV